MNLNEENRYLLTNLLALLVLTIILWGLDLNYSTLNFIILGFCWNLTLHAPTLRGRLELKKYKFSLLRLIYGLDNFLLSFSSNFYLRILLRSLPPIVLSFGAYLISTNGWFIASLIGSIYFELVYNRNRFRLLLKKKH